MDEERECLVQKKHLYKNTQPRVTHKMPQHVMNTSRVDLVQDENWLATRRETTIKVVKCVCRERECVCVKRRQL